VDDRDVVPIPEDQALTGLAGGLGRVLVDPCQSQSAAALEDESRGFAGGGGELGDQVLSGGAGQVELAGVVVEHVVGEQSLDGDEQALEGLRGGGEFNVAGVRDASVTQLAVAGEFESRGVRSWRGESDHLDLGADGGGLLTGEQDVGSVVVRLDIEGPA
jgi:hypothetical protein